AQDYDEAFKWMEKAALQGNASAQTGVGICYYYGYGVKRNKNTGREWINKAAVMGDSYAKDVLKTLK
ncbi:sel1 repeat family protein, partial [Vibrio sp. FNV 38]|nr:sel1 repeat family protein [Vibrio sp. FNV 38]